MVFGVFFVWCFLFCCRYFGFYEVIMYLFWDKGYFDECFWLVELLVIILVEVFNNIEWSKV